MASATFRIWRGAGDSGKFVDYKTEVEEGMVVLDVVHRIQATQANDLAVRWNCKAGKCGSCSAEINGSPRLMCMTRMNTLPLDQPVTVEPMHTFPRVRDLVTDVSWNYEVKKKIPKFAPRKASGRAGWISVASAAGRDVDHALSGVSRVVECAICARMSVAAVLRDHSLHDKFIGPRFFVYTAALEMNPIDTGDRLGELKNSCGLGYCNITKCCTKVCPEEIKTHGQRHHTPERTRGG